MYLPYVPHELSVLVCMCVCHFSYRDVTRCRDGESVSKVCVLKVNVDRVATMSRKTPPCSWTFSTSCFFCAAASETQSTIPTPLPVSVGNIFTSLLYYLVMMACFKSLSDILYSMCLKHQLFYSGLWSGIDSITEIIRASYYLRRVLYMFWLGIVSYLNTLCGYGSQWTC